MKKPVFFLVLALGFSVSLTAYAGEIDDRFTYDMTDDAEGASGSKQTVTISLDYSDGEGLSGMQWGPDTWARGGPPHRTWCESATDRASTACGEHGARRSRRSGRRTRCARES